MLDAYFLQSPDVDRKKMQLENANMTDYCLLYKRKDLVVEPNPCRTSTSHRGIYMTRVAWPFWTLQLTLMVMRFYGV